jgi:hypothetical protein
VLASPPVALSEGLIAEITLEFPAFRLVSKRGSALSVAIDRALRIVTLGAQRDYLTRYHTVLGYTLYTPLAWESTEDVDRAIVLRHERVHLRQRRRYGMLLMSFLYLIPFFPIGLAYGRARLEWEAYRETLRATAELCGLSRVREGSLRQMILERFTGGAYGWMWPFPKRISAWYDDVVRELETEMEAA